MYRPIHGTIRQTRMQGMGNCAPDIRAREREFSDLLKDAIKDEKDAIYKYESLLREIQILPVDLADRMKISEVVIHIRDQEKQHNALLDKLLTGKGKIMYHTG